MVNRFFNFEKAVLFLIEIGDLTCFILQLDDEEGVQQWQSVGTCPHDVVFMAGGQETPMAGDSVVPLSDAVIAARQFMRSRKLPEHLQWSPL